MTRSFQPILKKEIAPGFIVWEYADTTTTGFARAELHGRHPATGLVINTACEETLMAYSGTAIVIYQNATYSLQAGDCYTIPSGIPYALQGDHLIATIITSPPWSAEQVRQMSE